MSPRDRKLALSVAVNHLHARRDPNDAKRWAYYAEETESWWSVSEAALLQYVEILDKTRTETMPETEAHERAYEAWAEQDSTAHELGKRL